MQTPQVKWAENILGKKIIISKVRLKIASLVNKIPKHDTISGLTVTIGADCDKK